MNKWTTELKLLHIFPVKKKQVNGLFTPTSYLDRFDGLAQCSNFFILQ